MGKTAEERGYFKGKFRTASGFKVRTMIDRKKDGKWKISSVGGESVPTAFLPFHMSSLPGEEFDTLEEAKMAVKSA